MFESLGLVISLIGFCISAYIYIKKGKSKPLVCPLKADCHTVLQSRFSKTFGVRNEILGLAYYVFVWSLYAVKIFVPEVATPLFNVVLALFTTGAFIFSLYLTAIQAFVLRSWCSWCLFSALCNTILFSLLFFTIPFGPFVLLLEKYRALATGVHTIGFILGAGAATITDILFFRFMKDNRISEEEKGVLDTLSGVIWAGIALLVFSGFALYLPQIETLNASPKFLLKAVVVGVVVINGFFLNFRLAPYLTQLSLDRAVAPTKLRRFAFALGGISLVSWYTALFLGLARSISFTFCQGLIGYGALLLLVIIGSQIFERVLVRKEPVLSEEVPPSV